MNTAYTFPFGQPVINLTQQDRSPKSVFVLGVYASAVHARWVGPDGKTTIVGALAVASEPYIFWRGENAPSYIPTIDPEVGKLVPAPSNLNGPSGKALDDLFLTPMGVKREQAWLCDIVPHSCRNPSQAKAIQDKYVPLMQEYKLPEATVPLRQKPIPPSEKRRNEILLEIQKAEPETIVLLGDEPIEWFLWCFDDEKRKRLADFGETPDTYGRKHEVSIAGRNYEVLPLVHPRQASKLGTHSEKWFDLHQKWINQKKADRK